MKQLLKFMKKYTLESILGPFFKLFEALLELFVPLIIAKIIDIGIRQSDINYIIKSGLMLVLLASAGLAMSITAQYFAAKASVSFVTDIRSELFRHIQSLSFADTDKLGTSTAITRMTSDMNQLQTGVNLALRLLLRSPFVVFGAMIMAFTVDTKSALIFVFVIPVLSIVVFGVMLIGIPLYKKVQKNLDSVTRITRENLAGVRVIRAFAREEQEIEEFFSKNKALVKIQEFAGRISAIMNPATYAIINIAIIALIYTGAIRVNSNSLSQGNVIALYNYMSQILIELIKLASLIISITKSVACGNRIQEILDIKPSNTYGNVTKGKNSNTILKFDNVSLKYNKKAQTVLDSISLELERGKTLGVIGGTGSGKTSLVNLIPGFYRPTEGDIYIDGENIKCYTKDTLQKYVAVAEQKSLLFKGTVRENMQFGNDNATDGEITEALKKAQAYDFLKEKEGFLDYEIEQNGLNLSGGQRQRLSVARALVKNAPILILDDSSSALDFSTDLSLRKAIAQLKDTSVVIVSQRTSSVANCDKIIVLDDGKQVGMGTHSYLLENCEIYNEIYSSQFKKDTED